MIPLFNLGRIKKKLKQDFSQDSTSRMRRPIPFGLVKKPFYSRFDSDKEREENTIMVYMTSGYYTTGFVLDLLIAIFLVERHGIFPLTQISSLDLSNELDRFFSFMKPEIRVEVGNFYHSYMFTPEAIPELSYLFNYLLRSRIIDLVDQPVDGGIESYLDFDELNMKFRSLPLNIQKMIREYFGVDPDDLILHNRHLATKIEEQIKSGNYTREQLEYRMDMDANSEYNPLTISIYFPQKLLLR